MSAGLSCGANMMRMILFLFNFCFWIGGLVIFAIGIWFRTDPEIEDYMDVANDVTGSDQLRSTSNLLIVVGFLILLVGFLGCCGACKASSWMLCAFTVMVSIIIILELGAVGLAIAYRGKVDTKVKGEMIYQVKSLMGMEDEPEVTATWTFMQAKLECCGVESYQDYRNSNYTISTTDVVPPTCCKLTNRDDVPDEPPNVEDLQQCYREASGTANTEDQINTTGCYNALKDWIENKGTIVIAAVFIFIILQVIGCVFAMKVRKEVVEHSIA